MVSTKGFEAVKLLSNNLCSPGHVTVDYYAEKFCFLPDSDCTDRLYNYTLCKQLVLLN